MAVAALKGFIAMQQYLYPVFACWNIAQLFNRITKCARVKGNGRSWLPVVYIHTKNQLRIGAIQYLKPRLSAIVLREQKQQPTIQRPISQRSGKRDPEHRRLRNGQAG